MTPALADLLMTECLMQLLLVHFCDSQIKQNDDTFNPGLLLKISVNKRGISPVALSCTSERLVLVSERREPPPLNSHPRVTLLSGVKSVPHLKETCEKVNGVNDLIFSRSPEGHRGDG